MKKFWFAVVIATSALSIYAGACFVYFSHVN